MIEDPKWTKVSTPHGEQAPLGRKAFPPFPARPNLPESLLGQWLNTLEVTPISAMKWVCRGGWFVDREIKDNDVCYFLAEGSVVLRKEGDDSGVVVEAGTALFLTAGTEFSIRPQGAGDATVYSIHYLAKVLHSVDLSRLLVLPDVVRGVCDAEFCERLCREYAWREAGWEQALKSGIAGLLMRTVRLAGDECGTSLDVRDLGKLELVAPALNFIEDHLERQDLNVGEIAEVVGMSTGHFRRVFQQATGASPVNWIQKRRIELACVHLRTRNATIREVAEQCGFKTETFFYTVFQKWTGKTPRSLRTDAAL